MVSRGPTTESVREVKMELKIRRTYNISYNIYIICIVYTWDINIDLSAAVLEAEEAEAAI